MMITAPQLVLARAAGGFHRVSDRLYRLRRKLATAGVGLLALVLAFHIVFGANGIVVYQKKRAEYRTLQKDLEQLQKDNQALSDQIRALKTDPQAIEREAREQLRYARPGEVIYLMPQPRPAAPPANAAAQKR
jgi:cell division protein FtsB